MKKLILGCLLVVALLLLFIGAYSAHAQMKTIEDPHGGTIVYGVVRGATKTATAMGSILRTIGDNCGERPQIGVQDKGPGIESADLEHIFNPFHRGSSAKSGQIHGTGLGLSLTKSTVEGMGGSISVKSIPNRGSKFTLHLPVAIQEKNESSENPGRTDATRNQNQRKDKR